MWPKIAATQEFPTTILMQEGERADDNVAFVPQRPVHTETD